MSRPHTASRDGAPGAIPDAVAPPGRHPRFPLLDGTRAIAVLCVIGLHVAGVAGALDDSFGGRLLNRLNVGVAIFFVISGFLLFRPFIAHRADGAPPLAIRDYLWNRLLRIYPAYFLVLTILIVVPGVTAFSGVPWWKEYGLIQTLPIGDSGICQLPAPEGCALAHTWSLVVEMTFYLALPVYVLASEALARRRPAGWAGRELALLALLSVVSILLEFGYLGVRSQWVDATFAGYFPWFAFGMALAVASVARIGPPAPAGSAGILWAAAAALFVGLALWLPDFLIFDDTERMIAFLGYGLIATLIVAPAVFGDTSRGLPRRLLRTPLMAWLGLVSYGLFLWHIVVAVEVGQAGVESLAPLFVITTAVTAAIAAVSYYGVERPILRRKRHGRGRAAEAPGGLGSQA